MNTIISLGIVLLSGLLAEKSVARYKIPAITAYILLGIFIGPHALHIVGGELIGATELFSNIVLSFIAFNIGENFSVRSFRRIGKSVIAISLMETFMSWILVTAGLYTFFNLPVQISLLYGSIAAATAPTATMMVVRQYKAKGLFTDLLLGIVAIDDAWGIIAFSISLAFAHDFQMDGVLDKSLLSIGGGAIGIILLSISVGLFVAFFVSKAASLTKKRGDMLTLMLGAVLLNTGICLSFKLSPLLSNMALGSFLINTGSMSFRFFEPIKSIDWPFYIIFYVLAGASLDLRMILTVGFLGLAYILLRIAGKITGAYMGGVIVKSDTITRRYIGLALMPQAGVALGLAIVARASFPSFGTSIFTTIAATTVFYELLGPLFTRYCLQKAGNIQ